VRSSCLGPQYGLVYPGIGWLLFRDRKDLPEELIFRVHYLGGEEATYTLNFSRGSSMMLAQYYMLLRLGRDGYRRIHATSLSNARVLAERLAEDPRFRLVGAARHLPIVTFSVAPGAGFSETGLSEKIRERGWILPAYTLPPDMEDRYVLRVVVKENFSRDMADLLWMDIDRAARALSGAGGPLRKGRRKPAVC
ncbi:MAG: Glutamate decarboxylase, partial [Leptospirillum sp. Group IV 'UBA BS']